MTEVNPALTRREALGAAAAAALLAQTAAAQTTAGQPAATVEARGFVFEDVAGNGVRPANHTGVPDVMVSNGRDVVLTGADGAWRLPVAEGDSLFVIKPNGWTTPIDPVTHLPKFSYVHQPAGTPDALGLRFRGVAPTGALPESIDFPLRRQAEPAKFDVMVFTDPQPESHVELSYVRDDVVAQAAAHDVAFGITTGDIMFDDLSLYPRHNRIVGTMGKTWYNCCGNHDMNFEAPDNVHSRETFKRVFGARSYAWQYGGVTFFALDNVEYLGNAKYQGHIGAAQLGFIRNVLAHVPQDALVVACMHIPLRTLAGSEPAVSTIDTADFLAAIGDRPHTLSFSGHTHTNEHHYLGDRQHHHHVLAAVSGSWWSGPFDVRGIPVALGSDGVPNGFHILAIDGNSYTTTLVPAHDPARSQLRLMLDSQMHAGLEVQRDYRMGELLGGTVPADSAGSTNFLVNLFDGGPKSKVAYSLDGGETFTPMQRVERLDPYVSEVYSRNAATKKPWVEAGKSSHIWQARLRGDLSAGTHRVTVRATDEYGRPHEAAMVLEVTAG